MVEACRTLLLRTQIPAKVICRDVNVSEPWLSNLNHGKDRAFDVRLVEALFVYLTGKDLVL